MKHLPIIVLVKIAGESVLPNPEEADHLRACVHCTLILQRFKEDHLKQIEGRGERGTPEGKAGSE